MKNRAPPFFKVATLWTYYGGDSVRVEKNMIWKGWGKRAHFGTYPSHTVFIPIIHPCNCHAKSWTTRIILIVVMKSCPWFIAFIPHIHIVVGIYIYIYLMKKMVAEVDSFWRCWKFHHFVAIIYPGNCHAMSWATWFASVVAMKS